jgi:hypothetical protein
MTDEDEKKKKPEDKGVYRESPPDAPPPPPPQPTEYQKQLQAEAEMKWFQQQVRSPTRPQPGQKAAIVAAGGLGCVGVIMWLLAIAGVGVLVLIGLIIFSCSR